MAGIEKTRVMVELQSEHIFVDIVGVGSILLPYSASGGHLYLLSLKLLRKVIIRRKSLTQATSGWEGNQHSAWPTISSINRVYLGGRNVEYNSLKAYILV